MHSADRILLMLLKAAPASVSGELIASRLGHVSRVAIHQHIQNLRRRGFLIEAHRKQGYRLCGLAPGLHQVPLQYELERRGCTPEAFTLLPTTDSTNDEAVRQLAAGRPAPFAVIARHQSRGRGRLGRAWYSESPENLYLSLAFTPRLPPKRMQTFSLWTGVSVCDFINQNLSLKSPVMTKWPNDLLHEGKKLCGILAESRMDTDYIRDLVIGIGININRPEYPLPPEIKARATNLADISGAPVEINSFSAGLITHLFEAYRQFIANTHLEKFHELWRRYDVLYGKAISLHSDGQVINGIADGITDEGTLAFIGEDGRRSYYNAGDVSLSSPVGGK